MNKDFHNFMDAVIAIGTPKNGDIFWFATGFIVSQKDISTNNIFYYIITNKHVVEGINVISIKFNCLGDELVQNYNINLKDKNGNLIYSLHNNDSSDVIAIRFNPKKLIEDKSIWYAIDINEQSLTLSQMETSGLLEGSIVYSLGFPMSMVKFIKTPICRFGCISRIRDAYLLKSNNCPTYLVDAQSFPGNSGGPIVCRSENNSNLKLIGILSAYIPYEDILISEQTNKVRMIQSENSGLTVVHPVERIKEVIDLEYNRTKKQV